MGNSYKCIWILTSKGIFTRMVFPAFITRKLFTVSSIRNLGETGKDSDYNKKLSIITESLAEKLICLCSIPLSPFQQVTGVDKLRVVLRKKSSLIQNQSLHLSNVITIYLSLWLNKGKWCKNTFTTMFVYRWCLNHGEIGSSTHFTPSHGWSFV